MRSRKDANHNEIARTFIDLGCTVFDCHSLRGGIGDLIIGVAGVTTLVEVKNGAKSHSRRKLTPAEQNIHTTWRGRIDIVESVEDAIRLVKIIRGERHG
jgi:hypothetical protein